MKLTLTLHVLVACLPFLGSSLPDATSYCFNRYNKVINVHRLILVSALSIHPINFSF